MAGLFAGLRAQANALPPAMPQSAPPAARGRGRGLFGGGQQNPSEIGLMERLSLIGRAGQGEGSYQELRRAREAEILAAQQASAARQVEDRLRAQLSPADGPNGSGTGAAPTTEQQMASINQARLLNPGVADQFAPAVMAQQRQEQARTLFADDPLAQNLFSSGNEEFLKSMGGRYRDEIVASGSVRNRGTAGGSANIGGSPVIERFDDRYGVIDPTRPGADVQYSDPRGPTYDEVTKRTEPINVAPGNQLRGRDGNLIAQGAPRVFSASQGVDLVQEDGSAIYSNDPAPNPADNDDRAAIAGFQANNQRFQNLITMVGGAASQGNQAAQPAAFDLSPANALGYKAALATGVGMTPEAAAYGNYVSEIRSAVSDALRLNVGPQTDQDAIREAQALLSNIDNKDYVLQRLPTVIANNNRLAAGRTQLMQQRRPQQTQAPQGGQQGGGQVAYDASGNRFVVRNGQWVRE